MEFEEPFSRHIRARHLQENPWVCWINQEVKEAIKKEKMVAEKLQFLCLRGCQGDPDPELPSQVKDQGVERGAAGTN